MRLRQAKRGRTVPEAVVIRDTEGEKKLRRRGESWLAGAPLSVSGAEMSLRLVFMGTPDFAVPTLVEIVGRGHDVAAVYTRAPKPAGARHGAARQARSSARRAASGCRC